MKTEVITLEDLADMLFESKIINTIDQGLMISHTINHPTLGKVQTIQGGCKKICVNCH
jgi:hypothetical protein